MVPVDTSLHNSPQKKVYDLVPNDLSDNNLTHVVESICETAEVGL